MVEQARYPADRVAHPEELHARRDARSCAIAVRTLAHAYAYGRLFEGPMSRTSSLHRRCSLTGGQCTVLLPVTYVLLSIRRLRPGDLSGSVILDFFADELSCLSSRPSGPSELPAVRHDRPPFETQREALDLPAVQAIYEAFPPRADPGVGRMPRRHTHQLRSMAACHRRPVSASAPTTGRRPGVACPGFEPQTAAVIAGLITRAHHAGRAREPRGQS